MSIEEAILKLAASLDANTAALQATGGATPAAAPTTSEKPRGRPPKAADAPAPVAPAAPSVDRSTVNAALEKVKEEKGVEIAKGIISSAGKATKRADIAEANLQAVYDACAAAMEGGDDDM